MPLTRPAEISDCVSLSDKVRRSISVRRFVSEDGTVDALLSAGVDELAPNEHRVCIAGSQDDFLARSSEKKSFSTVPILVAGVVSLIEFKATRVAILGQIPKRFQVIAFPWAAARDAAADCAWQAEAARCAASAHADASSAAACVWAASGL
jgi:hypothetical protein